MKDEKPRLTISLLIKESQQFCILMSQKRHENIIGITDGKAIGTYIEHRFKENLVQNYMADISQLEKEPRHTVQSKSYMMIM